MRWRAEIWLRVERVLFVVRCWRSCRVWWEIGLLLVVLLKERRLDLFLKMRRDLV
jgi:hypothetical protein